ncbi:glycogenin-2 isoform X1 [Ornithorhynchus anatinus]|uniref:glycogenin-2 isoform X1 n=1 Tax=Ornithorhynchus anatinus TaxID=9258 RepID=UPI0010A84C31|nr:glycogenin-2 isoform X1 [Ornithorhynchus anatinus]
MPVTDQAFVTLSTNDVYCHGALVLGQSLRNHRATRKLVILITPQVSGLLRRALSQVFDEVIEVNLMDSADPVSLALLRRPELGAALTKLHCWTLTQYNKCVFMDADTLVLCNIDELFDREELSAAPDSGWPDCFNSGVFVFRPSLKTHNLLLQHAAEHGSFDGADQGLLNSFFSNWATADIRRHLPFIYNLSSSATYTYLPAFKQFGSDARVVHFLGASKPWHYKYHPQTGSIAEDNRARGGEHQNPFLQLWWRTYSRHVLPFFETLQPGEDGQSPGPKLCSSGTEMFPRPSNPTTGLALPVLPHPEQTPAECPPESSPEELGKQETVELTGTESSNPVSCEPGRPAAPSLTDLTEIQVTPAPVHKGEYHSADCVTDQKPEASQFLFFQEPVLQKPLAVDLAVLEPPIPLKATEPNPEEERRKWEEGQVDYLGKHAFECIQKKLDRFLQ